MISYETLLREIEKHVISAKGLTDEQLFREKLSAIRALCEVGLAKQSNTNIMPTLLTQGNTSNGSETMTTLGIQPSSLSSTKLQEDDANGNSIFDF